MGTVLVVEDDKEVAEILCKVLERMGHDAICAMDGDDGIRKFKEGGCDLVVTDMLMPRKSGIDLIKDLIREDPGVRIIAISGGSSNLPPDESLRTASFVVERTLQKPFTKQQFEAAVDRLVPRPGLGQPGIEQDVQKNWPATSDARNARQ